LSLKGIVDPDPQNTPPKLNEAWNIKQETNLKNNNSKTKIDKLNRIFSLSPGWTERPF